MAESGGLKSEFTSETFDLPYLNVQYSAYTHLKSIVGNWMKQNHFRNTTR